MLALTSIDLDIFKVCEAEERPPVCLCFDKHRGQHDCDSDGCVTKIYSYCQWIEIVA